MSGFPRPSGKKGTITVASEPFEDGAMRWAFKGVDNDTGDKVVCKSFKRERSMTKSGWLPDHAMQDRAAKFARLWNREVVPRRLYTPAREIYFGYIRYAQVDYDSDYWRKGDWQSYEPFLYGEYKKFNSNGGFEDEDNTVMPAFSHWTWHVSGGRYLLCDLQGCKQDAAYWLTDPVIHSFDHRFQQSQVDLGQKGMELVLKGHRCNFLCKDLGLEPYRGPKATRRAARQTTYSTRLTKENQLRIANYMSGFLKTWSPSIPESIAEESEEHNLSRHMASLSTR